MKEILEQSPNGSVKNWGNPAELQKENQKTMEKNFQQFWSTVDGQPIAFIAPSDSDAGVSGAVEILREQDNYLVGESKRFKIINNIPVFIDDVETVARYDFYNAHYSTRSRVDDISSGYLSAERGYLTTLVSDRKIDGIVLELGCGTGILAQISANYIGLDYSLSAVFAEGFDEFRRFAGDAQRVPLKSSSIQLIVSISAIEHIPKPELALSEIDRLLEPGGYAFLHPAWNCTAYNTKLIPILPYEELSIEDKLCKFLLPVLRNNIYKSITRIPYRILRLLLTYGRKKVSLKYKKLIPYLGSDKFIADCDATASIDPMDVILYFSSRGYECLSHPSLLSAVLTRHRAVLVQKPY